ncbi:hypothetical protein HYC85_001535 [Camellia sinensis]|uniref:Tyrosine specific protein phosphatases domain-containing protein n=1 Tax=Camellia sinensis TaxID=4442 RepID=A0A7J7I740_CAMSI|nr:hypothetical protein HYC85_001535 [Camellia sinensis]
MHNSAFLKCIDIVSAMVCIVEKQHPLKILIQNTQRLQTGNAAKSTFARLASSMGLHLPAKASGKSEGAEGTSTTAQSSVLESLTKGFVDSFLSAVKAVQVNARHIVSQNKRRYQGFYRNHMEEVIKFFETHHKGKYKVYNLCSERLYDASLFEGKILILVLKNKEHKLHLSHLMTIIAPPIELITLFCQSAYTWLKEDILNVVVVHCKAGMARTGLMISSLLLFLKFFPTAEECIEYYNQKRCLDGKGLILPSQIRYVKYFERLLTYVNGVNQPGRRCMLRGFRLVNCTYWIRPSITIADHNGILFSTKKHPKTKDLMIFGSVHQKKGIVVFALLGEPSLTELSGDFKLHFHDRQGDFYWSLDLSSFVFLVEYDNDGKQNCDIRFGSSPFMFNVSENQDNDDDVFSDSDGEETVSSKSSQARADSGAGPPAHLESGPRVDHQMTAVTQQGVQAEYCPNSPANSQKCQQLKGTLLSIQHCREKSLFPCKSNYDLVQVRDFLIPLSQFLLQSFNLLQVTITKDMGHPSGKKDLILENYSYIVNFLHLQGQRYNELTFLYSFGSKQDLNFETYTLMNQRYSIVKSRLYLGQN